MCHYSNLIFFPLSENSGGHNHKHTENQVCTTLKDNHYCYCILLYAVTVAVLTGVITYCMAHNARRINNLELKALVLQPIPAENGADDENKKLFFRQFSDKVTSVCLIFCLTWK